MAVGVPDSDRSALGQRDVFDRNCPAHTILGKITSRWGVLILATLRDGPMRYHVVRDRIGSISEKMLPQNLRTFTEYGLAERTVESTVPPQVYYSLTPMGHEVADKLHEMQVWVSARTEQIMAFQAAAQPASAPDRGPNNKR